jgi:hypothetical protein
MALLIPSRFNGLMAGVATIIAIYGLGTGGAMWAVIVSGGCAVTLGAISIISMDEGI